MSSISKAAARQTNPVVAEAADQVAKSQRRRRSPKVKDLPCWECRDQMALFDASEVRK